MTRIVAFNKTTTRGKMPSVEEALFLKHSQDAGITTIAGGLRTMSEPSKALTRQYFKAYETGDIEAVMKFIHPHYLLHPGGGAEPMNYEERKSDETVFFSAFSNIEAIVEDQIAEGDKVASRITMRCTHSGEYQGIPATGKRITITYMDVASIRTGKIMEEWVEFDILSILKQIRS